MNEEQRDDLEGKKPPPLHARLFWYVLTAAELALLKAMVEHCWDGSVIWASIPRLAAYSKLSEKQVQRLIHGWDDKRFDKERKVWVVVKHNVGLTDRGILSKIAPANEAKCRPATYRLNEAALVEDPKMVPYRAQELQDPLPGIHRPAVPGEPIRPRQKVSPGVRPKPGPAQSWMRGFFGTPGDTVMPGGPRDTMSPGRPPDLGTPCRQPGDTMSPDSLLTTCAGKSVDGVGSSSGVEILKGIKTPTTSDSVPVEIANGLREILPLLDDAAIRQLWLGCRDNAPDCTVEEVLYFAREKAPALETARNPAGLLIFAVPLSCNPTSLGNLREKLRREQEAHARAAEQRAAEERATEHFVQQEMDKEARAKAELEAMTPEEKQQLREAVTIQFRRECPNAAPAYLSDPGSVDRLMLVHLRRKQDA